MRKLLITILSFVLMMIVSPSSNAWVISNQGENAIGDRQFASYVTDVITTSTFSTLSIGCTETYFQILIVSEERFDTSKFSRIRYDSKKAINWSVKSGRTTSDGVFKAVDLKSPKLIYANLLKSKNFAIQLVTEKGGLYTMKFDVSNTSKLSKGLRAAGCKV